MKVAVTFCNQHSSPKLSVAAVDLDTGERGWLDVPGDFDRGGAGIATDGDDLLVACQPGGIVRYDRDLRPVAMLPTPGARNLHSLVYRAAERAIYLTSAHNDTLFRYQLDDTGTRVVESREVFVADPQRRGEDRYHLNSVTDWDGELYVTMFGAADGPTHKHRRNGRLVRVGDGVTVVEGLYHPHTSFVHDGALFVVESQARTVRRVAGGPESAWTITGGYPRGLVATGPGTLWVGVSALRRESSSLGTKNVIDSSTPLDFRTRLVELDLRSGETGRAVDLTALAAEVFDLRALPVPDAFVPDPDGGLAARVDALEGTIRDLREARNRLQDELRRTPVRRLQDTARRVRRRARRH